jgi:hypothetical protein
MEPLRDDEINFSQCADGCVNVAISPIMLAVNSEPRRPQTSDKTSVRRLTNNDIDLQQGFLSAKFLKARSESIDRVNHTGRVFDVACRQRNANPGRRCIPLDAPRSGRKNNVR